MKLLAIDLFCGGGGACIGMQQAGFEVVGVDIKPHRNYPGHHVVGDIHNLPVLLHKANFIWSSPPCQKYSIGIFSNGKNFADKLPDLIPITREILSGHPFTCIENTPRSPIRKDLELTGMSVGLDCIQRNRIFELSFPCQMMMPLDLPRKKWDSGEAITVWKGMSGTNRYQRERRRRLGLPPTVPLSEGKEKMGIPEEYVFNKSELGEAVAPPMAKFIALEAKKQILSSNTCLRRHRTEPL